MTTNPIALTSAHTVRDAVRTFIKHEIDGVPVVDSSQKMIGLFTKTTVYRMVDKGLDLDVSLAEVMARDVLTGSPEDKIENVLQPGIGRLPIVDGDGRLEGIITRTDLARVFMESYWNTVNELNTIIDSAYNMIVSVDEQGRVNVFNHAAEKILGIKADEVKGKNILDVVPSSGLIESLKTGKVDLLQKITINGKHFMSNRTPIKQDGKIIGAVAVLHDISELEEISKELIYVKELNTELDAIIESSFDGLYITDGNGVTLRLNKAFEMITGINGNEFLGKNVDVIKQEGIVSESVTSIVLRRKKPVTIIQKTRTGNTTLATGNPVFDKKGNISKVVCNVRDITELNRLKQKLEQLEGLSQHYENQIRTLRLQFNNSDKLVVNSSKMKDLLEIIMRLSRVDSTILVTGESGTGKELIVEIIHNNSNRSHGPFIKVNCGAIPENLLESELFGYEAGAFTGAKRTGNPGSFELANGGTIFLDEIGDLPFALQVKLLRVIQNKEITRVGSGTPHKVDIRIIAATNRNLAEMVSKKQFREDLYYRLNVIPLNVPSLRERKEDIPDLVNYFIQQFNKKYQMTKRISPDVIEVFMEYDWLGNVRELQNLIERLLVVSINDIVTCDDLPSHLYSPDHKDSPRVIVSGIIPIREAVQSVEKQLLQNAFARFKTTREIGRELKVDASTITRKAAKYGLTIL